MLRRYLQTHPFSVEAFFRRSVVCTWAVPVAQLRPLLPPPFQPDTFQEKWGFVAAALVQTEKLRPKGFPAFMGQDFFLVGYRTFVRYTTAAGKSLRGLYILGSETNRRMMTLLGSLLTQYRYRQTDLTYQQQGTLESIVSQQSGLAFRYRKSAVETLSLPPNSPFQDWKEARRFAGPLPFTFSFFPETNEVVIVEGVRTHWTPMPLQVAEARFGFIDGLPLSGKVLANAFVVEDVPYWWKKGRIEKWQP